MSKLLVFGASSLIGNFFIDTNYEYKLVCFSRKNKNFNFLDLQDETTFPNYTYENSFIVSFSPIWLIKNLLINLEQKNLSSLKTLKGIVVFSSSSATTKKYAPNEFDKNLSKRLITSENKILSICKKYSINCIIIRPTIIYGSYKKLDDGNFSSIIKFFKKAPFCIIPSKTGYRQPIHYSQLSKLTYQILRQFDTVYSEDKKISVIEVGGDEELSYRDLLLRLSTFSNNFFKRKCWLIPIPNKLFYLLFTPFLIFKPKFFDEIYRIQSDLSGFPKYSFYTGESPKRFPIDDQKNF